MKEMPDESFFILEALFEPLKWFTALTSKFKIQ